MERKEKQILSNNIKREKKGKKKLEKKGEGKYRRAFTAGETLLRRVQSFVERQGPAIITVSFAAPLPSFHLMVPLHYTRHYRCVPYFIFFSYYYSLFLSLSTISSFLFSNTVNQ
jgi:hypothetical protein